MCTTRAPGCGAEEGRVNPLAALASALVEVRFTKLDGRRYLVKVDRELGPQLAERQGPGYDDHLPHEAVHFIVEAEAGLTRGIGARSDGRYPGTRVRT